MHAAAALMDRENDFPVIGNSLGVIEAALLKRGVLVTMRDSMPTTSVWNTSQGINDKARRGCRTAV
jgi:hypothetical protein